MTAARLHAHTVEVPDPGDLLHRQPEPNALTWVRGGEGLVAWGEALRVDLGGGEPIERAAESVRALAERAQVTDEVGAPGSGLVAFFSGTFDPARSGSLLLVPRVLLGRSGGRAWVTTVEVEGPPPQPRLGPVHAAADTGRIRYAGSFVDELAWLSAVAEATRRITAGELEKVVLARDLVVWAAAPLDGRILTRRLAERFPDCFTFSVDGLIGATPELLMRRRGESVESLVLAGTAARGADEAEDRRLGDALLGSCKDLDEHEHAVASVRDVLAARGAQPAVDGPTLLRLANVQHLATEVRGRLAGDHSVLDLAAAVHPTAAVCGTPTPDALRLLRSLEGLDRGRYAGPVGWVDAAGDGELGIALRCALVEGTRARLYAGAGVVAGSLPEAELEETRLKFRAFQTALAG